MTRHSEQEVHRLGPALTVRAGGRRSRPKRVALVTPAHFAPDGYIGGGERYPVNLAHGLIAADPRAHVDIVAVGANPRTIALEPRLTVHILPVTLPGRMDFDHVSARLPDVLAESDLIHVHQAFTRTSQLAIMIAKVLGKPLVLTDHGARTNNVDTMVPYVDVVDLVISQSRFGARQIAGGKARTQIPGGVDDHFFRPADEPVKREFVMCVARQLPHKGLDRLLCALPRELPCVIVGRAYDARYAAYLRALAITRDVTFVEDADDLVLRHLYRRAWAAVFPSVHRDAWGGVYQAPELMGIAPLEAMACGTPTVVSETGALPEFVEAGVTGFVYGDLGELRDRLTALATGDLDSDELGANARRAVETKYSLAAVGRRVWACYEDLWHKSPACAS